MKILRTGSAGDCFIFPYEDSLSNHIGLAARRARGKVKVKQHALIDGEFNQTKVLVVEIVEPMLGRRPSTKKS